MIPNTRPRACTYSCIDWSVGTSKSNQLDTARFRRLPCPHHTLTYQRSAEGVQGCSERKLSHLYSHILRPPCMLVSKKCNRAFSGQSVVETFSNICHSNPFTITYADIIIIYNNCYIIGPGAKSQGACCGQALWLCLSQEKLIYSISAGNTLTLMPGNFSKQILQVDTGRVASPE